MTGLIPDSQIIIIEGADATGKSTLTGQLVEQQDRVAFHAGPPTSNSWKSEYVDPLHDLAPVQSLVLDRWHVGEYVWPQLMERKSLYESPLDLVECHEKLVEMGAYTIVLVRPIIAMVTELSGRGNEDERAIELAVAGQETYLRVVRSFGLARMIMTTLPVAQELLGLENKPAD